MVLCSVCSSLDIHYLLVASSDQSHDIEPYHKADYFWHSEGRLCFIHHEDIFQVQLSADGGCELCRAMSTVVESANADREIARGLRLVLSISEDKIIASYDDSIEGLIELCRFDLYVERDSFLKEKGVPSVFLNKIHRDPGSQSCLALASRWLQDCLTDHRRCNADDQNLPTRILNVGNSTQNPYLTEHPTRQRGQWAALSYCWGREPSFKLTQNTVHALRQGVPLNEFDATIRDALLVTRGLGIPYLWVDALCIFQDPGSNDWTQQSSKMDEIYGGSTVTIAAIDSSSVAEGFVKGRDPQYIAIEWRSPCERNSQCQPSADWQHVYLAVSWDPRKDEPNGPLTKRGWTMQEGLMPSRMLLFSSHQMMWKCHGCINFERGISETPLDDIIRELVESGPGDIWSYDIYTKFKLFPWQLPLLPDDSISERYRLWHDIIREYTPRSFTYIQDRLIAVAGLAKIYGDIIGDDQYFAGLWKQDMLCGLSWHIPRASLIPVKSTTNIRRGANQIPSWSWASTGPNVTVVNEHARKGFRALAHVEDVEVDLVDPSNRFGAVNGGKVIITGPLMHLKSLYNDRWECPEASMSALERFISEIIAEESPQEVEKKYSHPSLRHFAALAMLQHFPSVNKCIYVLLLERSSNSTGEDLPSYKRIGSIELEALSRHVMASPELVKSLEASKLTRRHKLGLGSSSSRTKRFSSLNKAALEDYSKNPWPKRTIIII